MFGLTEAQARTYRCLVELGSASADDLAQRLDGTSDEAQATLDCLAEQGLVTASSHRADHFTATPPTTAFGGALVDQRRALQEAESAVATLSQAYGASVAAQSRPDLFEAVTGVGPVSHRFQQVQSGAVHEVLALTSAAPTVVRGEDTGVEEEATARGVDYRIVIELAAMEQDLIKEELAVALARGQQVRVVDRVPMRLVVADWAVAMLPLLSPDEEEVADTPAAAVVRASGVVDALVALFESVWAGGQSLQLSPSGQVAKPSRERPDDTDLLILGLMLAGVNDRGIARRVDVSLRTVQRRVRRLMEMAEVTTRMQLGWQAHERSWIDHGPES